MVIINTTRYYNTTGWLTSKLPYTAGTDGIYSTAGGGGWY